MTVSGTTVSEAADQDRRHALARFLRSRRERLVPADVGMPAGPRRRTPGLRREEVAQVSGVSVTWYTWLEQGRDITVSRQVLGALAVALKLTPVERAHLFTLAGEPLDEPDPAPAATPALQRMVDALEPHPAYLLDAAWDLLAWNRSEAALIGDPAELPREERNILRLVFTEPRIRALLVNWSDQARSLLAQYRADAARYFGDPRIERLTEHLRSASPEFRAWWEEHDVAQFRPACRQFDHPVVGLLSFDYVKLSAVDTPGVKLFACMPADEATAAKLPRLTGCSEAPRREAFAVRNS